MSLAGCKVSGSLNLGGSASDAPAAAGPAPAPEPAEPAGPPIRFVHEGDKLVYENGEIEFATNSATLRGRGTTAILDELAAVLKRYPDVVIRIEGHTDSRGSSAANKRLSQERATSLEASLIKRGIAPERLSTVGHGESRPTRPEPEDCHDRSEHTVPADKLVECHQIWTQNRRAAFVVTEGAEALPTEGATVAGVDPAPTPAPAPVAPPAPPRKKRPDWALRLLGGYALAFPAVPLHGGHVGLALHASARFGKRERGYIGGGPRLHYRGLTHSSSSGDRATEFRLHQVGPEGNLLVGGGSKRVVGLFSLRVGLGLSALEGGERVGTKISRVDSLGLGGWALGGVAVLGKLSPRWSLGGHAEAGVTRITGLALLVEVGLNVAWHFGRGRRDGI